MATRHPDETDGVLSEHKDEVGFLMLGLAQVVSIFAVWFAFWPKGFHMPQGVGYGFGVFFLLAGAFGFYLAFRTLSISV